MNAELRKSFQDRIRNLLIERKGQVTGDDPVLKSIRDEAVKAGFAEKYIAQWVPNITREIPWDYYEKVDRENARRIEQLEKSINQVVEQTDSDSLSISDFLNRLSFLNGQISKNEIQLILTKAKSLSLNVEEVARELKKMLSDKGFSPYPPLDPSISSIEYQLLHSVLWHDKSNYPRAIVKLKWYSRFIPSYKLLYRLIFPLVYTLLWLIIYKLENVGIFAENFTVFFFGIISIAIISLAYFTSEGMVENILENGIHV
jgi:hypothetical protein